MTRKRTTIFGEEIDEKDDILSPMNLKRALASGLLAGVVAFLITIIGNQFAWSQLTRTILIGIIIGLAIGVMEYIRHRRRALATRQRQAD
jgi:hypothetical protein